MLEDRVHGHLVAVDDVEHAVGDTRFVEQLGEEDRRRRVLLGRLEDERVAGRDGGREHPHRDHRREVERGDARHDAERLADLVDVDAGARLLGEPALEQVRDAARELEVLEAAGDLAERIRWDLAVLRGEVGGQLVTALVDQVADLEQDVGALAQRRGAPAGEGSAGGGDGGRDLVGRREVDVLRDDARSPGRRHRPGGPTCRASSARRSNG